MLINRKCHVKTEWETCVQLAATETCTVVLHDSCMLFKQVLIEQAQEEKSQQASFAVGSCANRLSWISFKFISTEFAKVLLNERHRGASSQSKSSVKHAATLNHPNISCRSLYLDFAEPLTRNNARFSALQIESVRQCAKGYFGKFQIFTGNLPQMRRFSVPGRQRTALKLTDEWHRRRIHAFSAAWSSMSTWNRLYPLARTTSLDAGCPGCDSRHRRPMWDQLELARPSTHPECESTRLLRTLGVAREVCRPRISHLWRVARLRRWTGSGFGHSVTSWTENNDPIRQIDPGFL
jgi:hypothetical protein